MVNLGRQVTSGGGRVRSVMLEVTQQPGGYMIRTPQARGWGAVVRSQPELAKALVAAFREVEIAGYARWRGEGYDMDTETVAAPRGSGRPVRSGNRARRDVHPAEDWSRLPDGRWRSPSGRVYREGTRPVEQVRQRRKELGLPH